MDDYYSIPALSASGINAFYKSPLHFWRETPFNANRIQREETAAMLFGKVTHKIILEEQDFFKEFIISPEINKRTNLGKEEYEAFLKNNKGKTVIDPETYRKARELKEAFMKNAAVCDLLEGTIAEKSLFWDDDIRCKAKLDLYRNRLILDYKTTISASEEEFKKSLINYGYHRQAAWYMEGAEREYGERPKAFVFIVQEKDIPEAIGIYSISPQSIAIGEQENFHARKKIAERLKNADWRAYPEKMQEISLPEWYKTKAIGE